MNIHTVCLMLVWPKCDHAYSKRVISGLAAGPTRSLTLKRGQCCEGSVSAFVILGNRQMNNKRVAVTALLLVMSRNLQSLVVSVCTPRFNLQKFFVLPTLCIYVFYVVVMRNSYYFSVQH